MRTMKWIHAGLCAAVLMSGGAALAEQAPSGDQGFLAQALATNRIELQLGRLAIEHAATPEVQAMGQKMIQKHTELGQQLNALALQSGATATAETATEKETVASLVALPGGEFDTVFKKTIDDIHRRELTLYESEAKSATHPELRMLADRRVTALRKNLVDRQPAKQQKDW